MSRGFRGVKDDLSEIGRHLLDVACFLTPIIAATAATTDSPPASPRPDVTPRQQQPKVIAGALNDLAELGVGLRTGIARLSSALKWTVVSSRDSSSSFSSSSSSSSSAGSGIREEVLRFVRDLAKCAESWTEFPVPVDDNFDMSSHQRDHITTVECLAPSLATLRITLCPRFMSEHIFWKIYFALLHPKLNELESEFLSTMQIVEEMRINLKKSMQTRVASESENPVAADSCSEVTTREVDTRQGTIQESPKTNMSNSMNTKLQNPTAESSSSMMSEKAEAAQTHVCPTSSSRATALQYFDKWFETPATLRGTDAIGSLISSKDYTNAEAEGVTGLSKNFGISPSVDPVGRGFGSGSYYERLELSKNPYSGDHSRYHDEATQQLLGKASTDEESTDWNAAEDVSDFEIVERL